MHTELTLSIMDEVTVALGKSLRNFQESTCSAFDTRELRREAGARRKRQAKAAAVSKENLDPPTGISTTSTDSTSIEQSEGALLPATKKRKRKTKNSAGGPPAKEISDLALFSDRLTRLKKPLSLNTYKNHSLGDYTDIIRKYGTTDSYSTEIVRAFTKVQGTINLLSTFTE